MKIFKNSPLNRIQSKRLLRHQRRATNRQLIAEVKLRLGRALCGRDLPLRNLLFDHFNSRPDSARTSTLVGPKVGLPTLRPLRRCSPAFAIVP